MATGEIFTVKLAGGGPWGFRLQGGADFGMPLQIAKVRKRSKADKAGVCENDVILTIDGRDMTKSRHTDAMALIDAATRQLDMQLRRDGGAPAPQSEPVPESVQLRVAAEEPSQFNLVFSSEVSSEPVTESFSESSTRIVSSSTVSDGFTIHTQTDTKTETRGGQGITWEGKTETTTEPVGGYGITWQAETETTSNENLPTDDVVLQVRGTGTTQPVVMQMQATEAPSQPVVMQVQATKLYDIPDARQVQETRTRTTTTRTHETKAPVPRFNAHALHATQTPKFNVSVNERHAPAADEPMVNGYSQPFGDNQFLKQEQLRSYEKMHTVKQGKINKVVGEREQQIRAEQDRDYEQRQREYQMERQQLEREKENVAPKQPLFTVSKVHVQTPDPGKWQPANVPTPQKSQSNEPKPIFVETQLHPREAENQFHPPPMWAENQAVFGDSSNLASRQDLIRIVTKGVPLPSHTIKHIPGMIKPSSLDLVHPFEVFPDISSPDKKKKVFSDSAFYDDPSKNYPTIEDQIKLCHTIASSLEATANKKARGATMFAKRKNRARRWTTGSGEGDADVFEDGGLDGYYSEEDQPLFHFRIPKISTQVHEAPIKTYLTKGELDTYKNTHDKMYGGSPLSPDNTEVTSALVNDLHQNKGRGAKIFAKRRARCENYVIDETNVKTVSAKTPQAVLATKIAQLANPPKAYLSPWEAAAEDPYGGLNKAFEHLDSARVEPPKVSPKVMPKPHSVQPWRNTPLDSKQSMQPYQPSQPVYQSDLPSTPSDSKYADFNTKPKGWSTVTPPGRTSPSVNQSALISPVTDGVAASSELTNGSVQVSQTSHQHYQPTHTVTQTYQRQHSQDHNTTPRPWGNTKPADIAPNYTKAPEYSRQQFHDSTEMVQVYQVESPGYRPVDFRGPQRMGTFDSSTPQTEISSSDF